MKTKRIFILLSIVSLIIILLLCMNRLTNTRETFSDNRIQIYDWWGNVDEESEKFIKVLFSGVIDNYDKINIYSVFGNTEVIKTDKQLNIQITGESYYRDTNLFDINLIPEPIDKKKNMINFPYSVAFSMTTNIDLNRFLIPRKLTGNKSKFCLFSVTNCSCEQRNQMFKELSKYKMVDSCGPCMNNNVVCPGGTRNFASEEYCAYIANYKFMICFENKSEPNYFTEKLLISFKCGTIPIYWGCPNIEDYVNMDAILYLPSQYTENDMIQLIEKIKYLDNNADAYKSMYETYLFKNKKLPDCFDITKLHLQIENALNHPIK